MKETMVVGIEREREHVMTRELSSPRLAKVVLSTPAMIGLVEQTCLESVNPHLGDAETTVGTHVCVSHQAPVSEGETFRIRTRLTKVDRRRLTFSIRVDGVKGVISEGTHERAVVRAPEAVS